MKMVAAMGKIVQRKISNTVLSENFGIEYSMSLHKTHGWILFAGNSDNAPLLIGKDVVRLMHTHPHGRSVMSDADIVTQLRHWHLGGKGALEIIVRGKGGRAISVQYGRLAVTYQWLWRGLDIPEVEE